MASFVASLALAALYLAGTDAPIHAEQHASPRAGQDALSLAETDAPLPAGQDARPVGTVDGQGLPPKVTLGAPTMHVPGEAFAVDLEIVAPDENGVRLPVWSLSAAAFALDGKPLLRRLDSEDARIELSAGQSVKTRLDLGEALSEAVTGERVLTWEGATGAEPHRLLVFAPAPAGLAFMELPTPQLADYQVVMRTTQGDMWFELWPDVAPGHVRNFLDLCYTGFYDGTTFHRLVPGYIVQGGRAKEGTTAPRKVKAEFSTRRHLRGVLSAARYDDPDTADSEFFVVHAESPNLDGAYSAYGRLLRGIEVVDRLVKQRDPSSRVHAPLTPQIIQRAIVVKARALPESDR